MDAAFVAHRMNGYDVFVSQVSRGQRFVLEGNKSYWRGAPALSGLIFRPIVDENARVSEMLSGGTDITIEVPPELLQKAQLASGSGITHTVRTGLQLVAASEAYARLRQLRGKVRFSRTLAELKADR